MISASMVRSLLDYDPATGILRWRCGRNSGQEAGYRAQNGYIRITIEGVRYLAHRLAWAIEFDEWPPMLDHINRVRHDNRICNLRIATRQQNCVNRAIPRNICGLKGVKRRRKKFEAQIKVNRKNLHLGTFDTPEAAHEAYARAARLFFGEFACIE